MPNLQTEQIKKYDFYIEVMVNSFFILEIMLRYAMAPNYASFFKERVILLDLFGLDLESL